MKESVLEPEKKATIQSIERNNKKPELYRVKTSIGTFIAHELFFALDKKEIVGREVLVVADAKKNLIRALTTEGQPIYTHDEDVYNDYVGTSDAFLQHVQGILADEKAIAKAKKRVVSIRKTQENQTTQKKYRNMKINIQPWISLVCQTKDLVAPFSIADLEKIAFASACSDIVRHIDKVENYLGVRQESSCIDEKKETYMWETFLTYNKMAKKALDHRVSYNAFLAALEALIRDRQYVPR